MYKVLVAGRPFANLRGRGVERYTRDLVTGLRDGGVAVDFLGDNSFLGKISNKIPPYASAVSPLFYDLLAPARNLLRKKSVYDIAHLTSVSSGIIVPLLRSRARHVVVTCHDLDGLATEGMREEQRSIRGRLYLAMFKKTVGMSFAQADRIVADSTQTAHEVSVLFGADSKVVVVNPGISASFRPGQDMAAKLDKGYVSLGYVGVLTVSCRLDKALRVVRLLRERGVNARFTVVGDGPFQANYSSMAQKLGIGDIVDFRGFIPENQLVVTYNKFDFLLHPVLYEGFGYPILEAQACGVPVVLFKDARVSSEVSRLALKSADEEDAALSIESLVTAPSRYHDLCCQSLGYASSFSPEKMISEIQKIYGELVGKS